jgi:excisionase family DNA binding protein
VAAGWDGVVRYRDRLALDGGPVPDAARFLMIDLAQGLAEALRHPEVRDFFRDLIADVVREELDDPRNHNPDQLLPVKEAAALLGMTPAALRQAAARGTIPWRRIGRRLRFRRGDLLGTASSPRRRRQAT